MKPIRLAITTPTGQIIAGFHTVIGARRFAHDRLGETPRLLPPAGEGQPAAFGNGYTLTVEKGITLDELFPMADASNLFRVPVLRTTKP